MVAKVSSGPRQATVARRASISGSACLAPEEEAPDSEGGMLELCYEGRTLVARASEISSPGATDEVRLSRDQCSILGVGVGDTVTIEDIELQEVSFVQLLPLFPVESSVSEGKWDEVLGDLVLRRIPIQVGGRLSLRVSNDGREGLFEVVDVAGGRGLANEGTALDVLTPRMGDIRMGTELPSLKHVPGRRRLLEEVRAVVEVPLRAPWIYRQLGIAPPRSVLLYGPPGGGKSYLARVLVRRLGVHAEMIAGPEVVGLARGETEANLRRVFANAVRRAPSLVVIDEVEALAPRRAEVGAQADYRMVAQVLALMDGLQHVEGVGILATTNAPDRLDPALRRPGRLDVEVFVGPVDAGERLEILAWYSAGMPLSAAAEALLPAVAERTHGYLPADLAALVRDAGLRCVRRLDGQLHLSGQRCGDGDAMRLTIECQDFEAAVADSCPSLLRSWRARSSNQAGKPVGGMLNEAESSLVRDLLGQASEQPLRVALISEHGSGARVARAVAEALRGHVLEVTPGDLVRPWAGEGEQVVKDLFDVAALVAPTTVLCRDLDGIMPRHVESPGTLLVRRLGSQLLSEMEQLPADVSVIAWTAAPQAVDPAAWNHLNPVRCETS